MGYVRETTWLGRNGGGAAAATSTATMADVAVQGDDLRNGVQAISTSSAMR